MIQAKDLIINRYFELNGLTVKAINFDGLNSLYNEIKYLKPIPLNEEWLLKLGFEELNTKNRFITECGFEIEKQNFNYAYVLWGGEDAPFLTQFIGHCQYLHQLQNLYFALTNKELEIKEL